MTSTKGQRTCANCGATVPEGHHYCGQCGTPFGGDEDDAGRQTLLFGPMMTPGRAKLILIRGTADALPGLSFHLNATHHHTGRRHGKIPFPDDPYVSPRHADFFYRDNQLHIQDTHSLNGSFVRINQPIALEHGDRFMVGGQVLQFERLDQHGEFPKVGDALMYVSPPKPFTFRLVQILAGGKPGRVYASPNNEVSVGREGCDMNFGGDRNVSRMHAKISETHGKYVLTDLDSRNGTFFKIRGEHPLNHGDYVFIGQHLLRVEIVN